MQARDHSLAVRIARLSPEKRQHVLAAVPVEFAEDLGAAWGLLARPSQLTPWATWRGAAARQQGLDRYRSHVIRAGRAGGKTRAGSEATIEEAIEIGPDFRGALVGRTAADTRDIMVLGESGILACCRKQNISAKYEPSYRRVILENGATLMLYSADEPDMMRGPQHHWVWADEISSWRYTEAWDEGLELGLRLGKYPRAIITSTPKRSSPLMRQIEADPATYLSRGSTYDNAAHLPQSFLDKVLRKYEGTTLGQQELHGEEIGEVEGALWKLRWISEYRWMTTAPALQRIVVGVDPPGGRTECGIIVAGRRNRPRGGPEAFVLNDSSAAMSPDDWGKAVIDAYENFEADAVVAEVNYGGDMVESNIRNVARALNKPMPRVIVVRATRGKAVRAEPVVGLYEQGRVHHVGLFGSLESEMTGWVPGETKESPNRLDALVWALTNLIVDGSPSIERIVETPTLTMQNPFEM